MRERPELPQARRAHAGILARSRIVRALAAAGWTADDLVVQIQVWVTVQAARHPGYRPPVAPHHAVSWILAGLADADPARPPAQEARRAAKQAAARRHAEQAAARQAAAELAARRAATDSPAAAAARAAARAVAVAAATRPGRLVRQAATRPGSAAPTDRAAPDGTCRCRIRCADGACVRTARLDLSARLTTRASCAGSNAYPGSGEPG